MFSRAGPHLTQELDDTERQLVLHLSKTHRLVHACCDTYGSWHTPAGHLDLGYVHICTPRNASRPHGTHSTTYCTEEAPYT